ncbi:hypothetical protein BD410DRAFT_844813 [Rickenella mellea]|uniref:Uncharacterized protein n=1 Tax=Rickenella mellea TaxID=50990 RepID=A0A4Y7PLD3_9AGAM|nr:hypothetical protein BD410DRAFT_844813 [Rickenella mellea]
MPAFVQPLFQVISEHTGLKISLLAGKVKGNGCIFTDVHVGETVGEITWDKHDPDGWAQTVTCFTGFLGHTIQHDDDVAAPTHQAHIEFVQTPLDADGEEEDEGHGTTSDGKNCAISDCPTPMKKSRKSRAAAKKNAIRRVTSKAKANATARQACQSLPTQQSNPILSLPTPHASPTTTSRVDTPTGGHAELTRPDNPDIDNEGGSGGTVGETGGGVKQPADGTEKWLADLTAELPTGAAWEWLRTHFTNLAKKNYSPEWIATLRAWVLMEELGDGNGSDHLTTTNRPVWVSWWINRCRTTNISPPIHDVPSYIEQWHRWWDELAKDSERLFRLGKNGFLNILMTLKWWRDLGTAADLARWDEAVAKVKATMVQLREVNLLRRRKRAAPAFDRDVNGSPLKKKQKLK